MYDFNDVKDENTDVTSTENVERHNLDEIFDEKGETNDKVMDTFKKCVEMCRESLALFKISQGIVDSDGKMHVSTVSENTFPVVSSIDLPNGYINLRLITSDITDIARMSADWKTMCQRNTDRILSGLERDYILTIDLIKEQSDNSGITYLLSFADPIFAAKEDKAFLICFEPNKIHFEIDKVDLVDVYNDTMYAAETEGAYDSYDYSETEIGEDVDINAEEEYDENDDVLSNADILDVDQFGQKK